jgi:hypothetical protein
MAVDGSLPPHPANNQSQRCELQTCDEQEGNRFEDEHGRCSCVSSSRREAATVSETECDSGEPS